MKTSFLYIFLLIFVSCNDQVKENEKPTNKNRIIDSLKRIVEQQETYSNCIKREIELSKYSSDEYRIARMVDSISKLNNNSEPCHCLDSLIAKKKRNKHH